MAVIVLLLQRLKVGGKVEGSLRQQPRPLGEAESASVVQPGELDEGGPALSRPARLELVVQLCEAGEARLLLQEVAAALGEVGYRDAGLAKQLVNDVCTGLVLRQVQICPPLEDSEGSEHIALREWWRRADARQDVLLISPDIVAQIWGANGI